MPDKLIIQFEDSSITWLVVDEKGSCLTEATRGAVTDLQPLTKNCELYILAPAKDILLTEIKLPKLSKRKLMKALPFALEDKLLDELGNVHFSLGERLANKNIPAAVVSKTKMDSWLKNLAPILKDETHFSKVMLPEALALPLNPRGWTVYVDGVQALVRLGRFSGFGIELKNMWPLLHLFLKKEGSIRPETVEIIGEVLIPPIELDFFKTEKINLVLKPAIPKLILMSAFLDRANTINLMQGSYQQDFAGQIKGKTYWIGLSLIALWLSILTLGNLSKLYILESGQERLNQEIQFNYEKTALAAPFSSATVVDLMKNELKRLQNENSKDAFLRELAILSPVFADFKQIKLESLEFENKIIILELEAANFSDVDQLIKRLKAKSFKIEHEDERKTENLIRARLTITESKE